jgi:hypothetical protein
MASVITAVGHGMVANDPFRFDGLTPTNSGVDEAAVYYVLATGLTADTFQFSTSVGGSAFVLTNAITDGTIVGSGTYAIASGTMAPPDPIATPSAPTLVSDVTSGIVRLSITLNTAPEPKVRAWEVQVTHKYSDEQAIAGSVTGEADTELFTLATHGLVADDPVRFTALTGGTNLEVGQTYYVIASGLTSSTFKVSLTVAGSAVDFTTDVNAGTVVDIVTPYALWTNARLITMPTPQTTASMPALGSTIYACRVRAQDVFGNYSSYSAEASTTTAAGSDALAAALADITNAVNGQVIDFDNIVDGAIRANHIDAGAVTADALSATIVLASLLTTSLTGRRVEIDAEGVRLLDASDEVVVNIPTDANTPVFFKGDIVANTLTAQSQNDLSGTVGLTGDGVMTLANGVSAPALAPGLSANVDSQTLTSTMSGTPTGVAYDSAYAGGPVFWFAVDPSTGYVAHAFRASTGVLVASLAATGSTTTYTTTLGSTSHVGDTWQAKSGSTDNHIASPLTFPAQDNIHITKVSVYVSGYGGDASCRNVVWNDVSGTGNALGYSSVYTAVSKSPSAGGAVKHDVSVGSIAVASGATVYAGVYHSSGSDGFWWDRDDGSGKTTYSGDGASNVDGTGWGVLGSASKINVYVTYTYDVDTRLETAAMIGVASDGTYLYTLDNTGVVWKYDIATLAWVANGAVLGDITGTKAQAGLFYDATAGELLVTTTTGTGAGVYPKCVRVSKSTLAATAVYSAAAGTTFSGTTDTFRGGARLADPLNGNAATYWLATTSAVYAYTFSGTTLTQTSDRHFGQAATVGDGLTHDGGAFRGFDTAAPTKLWAFSAWDWTTASAIYWLAYAWYDSAGTTHETAVSPRSSLTLRRRERLLVTTSAIPTGGADDPNNARIYMKPNATDPGAGAFKLQATDALTSRTLTDYNSAGAADGAGTAFPAGSPAEIRSSVATSSGGWSLKGDGSFIWKQGTSFPASPATNDRFFRTDYGLEFYYDGTRWVSTQLFTKNSSQEVGSAAFYISRAATIGHWQKADMALPFGTDWWLSYITTSFLVNSGGSALSASHKWSLDFKKGSLAVPATAVGSITIDSGSSNVNRNGLLTVGALLDVTNNPVISLDGVRTGTPGDLQLATIFTVYARIVAT